MELQPPCLELSSSDSSFEEANSISLIETEQRPSQEQSEDTFKERAHSRYTLLPECFNVEGTHSAVCIMLGDNQEAWPFLTDSVPLNWQKNGTFFVDTSTLKDFNDVKCDDNGGWQNDGVRRLWLIIKGSNLQDSNKEPHVDKMNGVRRGGKNPDDLCWCLTRTYFKSQCDEDFKKVITTLSNPQGEKVNYFLIRYIVIGPDHSILSKPHGNHTKGSTPYKRQLPRTSLKIKNIAASKKPKEVCEEVESDLKLKILGVPTSCHENASKLPTFGGRSPLQIQGMIL